MSAKFLQIICAVAAILSILILIPSTSSKYASKESYATSATTKQYWKFNNTCTSAQSFTLPHDGLYAIVLKGGNGGDGMGQADGSISFKIPGGSGGLVGIAANFSAGTVLNAYIGSTGVYAQPPKEKFGVGGTNKISFGNGGSGSYLKTEDANKLAFGVSATGATDNMCGAGGGAASVLTVNGTTIDKALMISGGGGGSSSWDYYFTFPNGQTYIVYHCTTLPAGSGGPGGSNVALYWNKTSGTNAGSGSSNNTTAPSGFVYDGANGTYGSKLEKGDYNGNNKGKYAGDKKSDSYLTYGRGGTTSPGIGGTTYENTYTKSVTGYTGSNFAASGKGADGRMYGGGGGGGFCGGGGGAGASVDYSSGGGGGGSSYVAENVYGTSNLTYSLSDSIVRDMLSKASLSVFSETVDFYEISSAASKDYGFDKTGTVTTSYVINSSGNRVQDGFIAIMYLGANTAENRAKLGI